MYKIIIQKILQIIIISYIGVLIHKYGYPFLDPTLIQPAPEAKIPDAKDLVESVTENPLDLVEAVDSYNWGFTKSFSSFWVCWPSC